MLTPVAGVKCKSQNTQRSDMNAGIMESIVFLLVFCHVVSCLSVAWDGVANHTGWRGALEEKAVNMRSKMTRTLRLHNYLEQYGGGERLRTGSTFMYPAGKNDIAFDQCSDHSRHVNGASVPSPSWASRLSTRTRFWHIHTKYARSDAKPIILKTRKSQRCRPGGKAMLRSDRVCFVCPAVKWGGEARDDERCPESTEPGERSAAETRERRRETD
ncbi:hypothetical protein F2P81_013810 [Scophthalmus maximus]|uniref:Uncharacterized protein n=1 Tax=Scophthalmus maximus TaxID=52904 RepID=A0A6A4SRS6_SCOMX|nr:hypothetical protein F2P81_013810 [Scophthalmus maximus]